MDAGRDAGRGADAGRDAGGGVPVPAASLQCAWPAGAFVGQGPLPVALYGGIFTPGAVGSWNGSPRPTTVLDGGLALVELDVSDLAAASTGALTIQNPGQDAGAAAVSFAVSQPAARRRISSSGAWTLIERRGWAAGYFPGELLQQWNVYDSVVGSTPAEETLSQMRQMRSIGIDTITFPISAADGGPVPLTPPDCVINSVAGPQYPVPSATELASLRSFLDTAQDAGIKVWLRTTNNHMEESPPINNAQWLGAVLGAVKGHPALDLVTFDGTQRLEGNTCGIPAEPPLWEGPTSPSAQYVTWAIGFAMDAGFPARQLSAEEIVGGYLLLNSPNLTPTVTVMKGIFDSLGIPPSERTYALSIYEQSRCAGAGGLPCVDEPADVWMDQTLQDTWDKIGRCSGSRVVAVEMGLNTPVVDGGFRSEWAEENLGALFERYGVEGGSYWVWVNTDTSRDSDPTLAAPIKFRGTGYVYSPVKDEILDLGSSHLAPIPNGSFERGDAGPDAWTLGGTDGGSGARYFLAGEPGQPEVATRGNWTLRLTSGSDPSGAAWADSALLPALPDAGYALTAQLRFSFSGDPDAGAPMDQRPQVDLSVLYFQADGGPSQRPRDDFRFFQEDSSGDFRTRVVPFVTPPDVASAQIELRVQRAGLPSPLTADFDDVR